MMTAFVILSGSRINGEDSLCIGQKEGTSFPFLSDCQQYTLCLGNDQSVVAKCPVGAWYDPPTGNCGPDISPTACRETEATSTTSSHTTYNDELCADQEAGVSFPFIADCQKYIVCLGEGKSAVVNCIYGAWFDPITTNCGPNVSPTACMETTTTEISLSTTTDAAETTTEITSTSVATTTTDSAISADVCDGLTTGTYVTYPDNCSKYIVCAEPIPIAFYCTPGYYFSDKMQECTDWDQSDCPALETPATTEPPVTAPSICYNNTGLSFPYPESCQWFKQCINDDVYMMRKCKDGDYYDPALGICSSTASPDACREDYTTSTTEETTTSTTVSTTKSTTTTTPSTTTTTPVPVPPTDPCAGMADGKLVPYPYDCTKFVKCEQPTPVIYDCVEGQEFSARLERCMAPWVANCVAIERPQNHWIY